MELMNQKMWLISDNNEREFNENNPCMKQVDVEAQTDTFSIIKDPDGESIAVTNNKLYSTEKEALEGMIYLKQGTNLFYGQDIDSTKRDIDGLQDRVKELEEAMSDNCAFIESVQKVLKDKFGEESEQDPEEGDQ